MTRTEKRRQDAIIKAWLAEHEFTSLDAFLDCYFAFRVTSPSAIEDLLARLKDENVSVTL